MPPDPSTPPGPTPIAMPEEIAEYYRKKKRFETQTPIIGTGCAFIMIFIFSLMAFGLNWAVLIPLGIINILIITLRYQQAQRRFKAWEQQMRDHYQ